MELNFVEETTQIIRKNLKHVPNILWSNTNAFVKSGFFLVLSIVFIRLGSAELFGDYLFVKSVFGLLVLVSVPGTRVVVLRAASRDLDGTLWPATRYSLIWSLPGLPVLLASGWYSWIFFGPDLGMAFFACLVFFPCFAAMRTWRFYLKGKARFRTIVILNGVRYLIMIALMSWAIVATKSIVWIMVAYFGVLAVSNLLYFLTLLFNTLEMPVQEGWKQQSWAASTSRFSKVFFGQADLVIMKLFLTSETVAIYGIVMKIVNGIFQVIQSTITGVLHEIFSSEQITIANFYKYFVLSLAVPVVALPFVYPVIMLLYGGEMEEAVFYTQVYLFTIPLYLAANISLHFLIKYKINVRLAMNQFITGGLVILLYLLLIPNWGIMGGIVASILYFAGEFLLNFTAIFWRKKNST